MSGPSASWGGALDPFRPRWRVAAIVGLSSTIALLELVGVYILYLVGVSLAGADAKGPNAWLDDASDLLGLHAIGVLAVLLLVSTLLRNAVRYVLDGLSMRFMLSTIRGTTERLFRATFGVRYEDFIQHSTSERMNTMTSEADRAGLAVSNYIRLMTSLLTLVLLVVLLVLVDWRAFAFGAVAGALVALLMRPILRLARRIGQDRGPAGREMLRNLSEPLRSYKAVVADRAEQRMEERLHAVYDRYERVLLKAGRAQRLVAPVLEVGLVTFVVIGILATLALSDSIDAALPVLVLLMAGAFRILPSLQSLFATWGAYRYNRPGYERVRDELAAMEAAVVPHADRHGAATKAGVVLQADDVAFAYRGGPPILNGVQLDLAPGERVAIVGPSGSGKSTFVDVVLGLLEPTAGRVRLGQGRRGGPARLGYVPQEALILDGTVLENLDLSSPASGIDRSRAQQVLEQVGLGAGSVQPVELDRPLAEGGARVSGGQRQRIGLARALYRDPDVLLLDEPTSSLDDATEARVLETLGAIRGTAMVIVTHRTAPLAICDRVYRLTGGRLVEEPR